MRQFVRIWPVVLLAPALASADVPRLIQYQGKLLSNTGTALGGPVSIRVRLYDSPTATAPVLFDESHGPVALSRGLFSIQIGSGTPGGVPDAAVASAEVYLGVSIDGAAELLPRRRIVTTPYTVKARSAEQLVRPGGVMPALTSDADGRLAAGTSSPDPSAAFDLSSSSGGFLPPRLTTAQRDAIANPAPGLFIYNMDTNCFNAWTGQTWKQACLECDFNPPTAGNNGPICAGETLNLSASTIPGAAYQWTGPNAFSSTDQNPSVSNATTSAGGVYSVTATLNNCTSSARTTFATVNPIPAAPTVSNNGPVCPASSLQLTASSVPGALYAWTGPDNFSSNSQNPVISNVTEAAEGDYTLTISVNGCQALPAMTSAVVAPSPPATPGNISGPTSYCPNESGVVYSIAAVPDATTYTWSVPPGASITSGQGTTSITVTYGSQSGSIIVSAGNSCGTSADRTLVISQACRSCQVILASTPGSPSGSYLIDPDGAGGVDPFNAYCDMTTDGGGWTLVFANPGGSSPWLTDDNEQNGNALSYQAFNVNRLKKEAISAISTESLFKRSAGPWLKADHALFDNDLTGSGNQHPHWQVTVTSNNGATASNCQMGYSNFNISGGGDYGITTSGNVFDHHGSSYYHVNNGCENEYLYNIPGYNVNSTLGSWTATASCSGSGEMGSWYAGMR